ncbi:hypothetical protein ACQPXM_11590 [Kribbella sp. CA-253562]|uniref:hypothetical protein n=1 Tax=Kribbella sp. CA-253562 TaxID=3239942 RepID=UPI003D8E17E6
MPVVPATPVSVSRSVADQSIDAAALSRSSDASATGGPSSGDVQTETAPRDDTTDSTTPRVVASGQAPQRGADSAATGTNALDAAELDVLARRLYEPIARRLRAELRLDRERIGTLLDRQ